MIQVTPEIALDETEIAFDFVRSSGPGGQNVNKVATAAQLRFNAANSASLPPEVRQRLLSVAGRRFNKNGTLIINAQRFRTQAANRQDAIERLVRLVRQAGEKPRPRLKTRPTHASQERRLEFKRRRSLAKRSRGAKLDLDN